jgi:hypothetical protein
MHNAVAFSADLAGQDTPLFPDNFAALADAVSAATQIQIDTCSNGGIGNRRAAALNWNRHTIVLRQHGFGIPNN